MKQHIGNLCSLNTFNELFDGWYLLSMVLFTGEFGQRVSIYHFAVDTVPPGFEEVARTIEENVNFSRRY